MTTKKIAFILAGGLGKRLRPYTYIIPKPLVPIGDKPILELIINRLKLSGINQIIISTGYKSNYIKAFFGNGSDFGVTIHYVEEDAPLGTFGPVLLAKDLIGKDDYVILMNGDIYTELNFANLHNVAITNRHQLTVGYITHNETSRYGVLIIKNNLIESVVEKPSVERSVSAGIYVFRGDLLTMIPANKYFTVPDLIELLLNKNSKIGSYHITDYWMGIEYVDDLNSVINHINSH